MQKLNILIQIYWTAAGRKKKKLPRGKAYKLTERIKKWRSFLMLNPKNDQNFIFC